MKLSDHVDKIRNLITASFDKKFARLGIGANKQIELEKLPEQVRGKRQHLEVMLENHIGETGCYQDAREKLLDELSFTLFNRLAAVKVMESANLFPPVITKQAEHGGRSFGHKAWLEEHPENRDNELEGIRDYFKYAFNELGDSLPLYSKEYPYALLPDAISLNEIVEAFNAIENDSQVEDNIWQSDDVLGWLYESYNNAKKQAFKDSKAKTEYDIVSLQSQVYTPRWVVQFLVENSLGKLYLEMYPESEIKDKFKIANAPKTQERDPKPLHELKLIDPASGSGNFLLYAFDFFYALYIDQIENYDADYEEDEISQLIIENNLHGIDLDDRAIQLAQLGLYIKARKKRRFIKGSFNFKVVSSDFYLPEYDEARHIFEDSGELDKTQKELIEDIWNDLRYAYKFGSLIRLDEKLKAKLKELESKQGEIVLDLFADAEIREQKDFTEKFFNNLKSAVEQFASRDADTFIANKTRDAITFLELLTSKYDVACANPPYTDSSDFGKELKTFMEANYKKPYKFNINLYATFIKRCHELTIDNGRIAMVHPYTFMFIKTFEDVRKFILKNSQIELLVDWGLDRVNLFEGGYASAPAFYILSKSCEKKESVFFNLTTGLQEKHKKEVFESSWSNLCNEVANKRIYSFNQMKFSKIISSPFIYWISDDYRKIFSDNPLSKKASVFSGIKTGNNNGALRFWWEVDAQDLYEIGDKDVKWVRYNKGGTAKKWYGNNWLCVDFRNDCEYIKKQKSYSFLPSQHAFEKKLNYSGIGSKSVSFRLLDEEIQNDMGASGLVPDGNILFALAVLNSHITSYNLNCLNPTVNKQPNDVKRVPLKSGSQKVSSFVEPLVQRNIDIHSYMEKYSIIELDYIHSPFVLKESLNSSIKYYFSLENHLKTQILINEAIINEKIFEVYELTEKDKAMILAKEGVSIGSLAVCNEARLAYLSEDESIKEFPIENISEYITNLPSKEFTDEEREILENGFSTLYQSNNDLEAYCIRHQINPINIWYWFKQSNVLPKQRVNDLAMEFLTDILREILMEDDDGITPLVPNSGEKILLDRVEEKFIGKGFSMSQYSSFDKMLGRELNDYIYNYFFRDFTEHLNLFMYLPKAPFIWHLTSGPEQGFDCYIIIYKWSRDNLMRIRSVYIEKRERALINQQSELAHNESVDAQNEKDKIFKQLKEIEAFKVKIDELLEEGYDPILDDGVGKNIAPLQKKKMLAYDVLNAGQLKKYLSADW